MESASDTSAESSYVASSSINKRKKKKDKDSSEMFCWYCSKMGLYRGDCFKRMCKEGNMKGQKKPDTGGLGCELDYTNKAIIAALSKSKTKQDMVM